MTNYLLKIRKYVFKNIYSNKCFLHSFCKDKYLNQINNERLSKQNPRICVSWDDLCLPKKSVPFDYGQIQGAESAWDKFIDFTKRNADLTQFIFYIPKPNFNYYPEYTTFSLIKNYRDCSKFIENKEIEAGKISKSIIFCLHGIHHNRKFPIDISSSMEFEFKSQDSIMKEFEKNADIFTKNKEYTHYKPPAWSLGQLDGKFNAFKSYLKLSNKIKYLHIISPSTSQLKILKNISVIHADKINEFITIPQNINMLWEKDYIKKIVDKIIEKGGIINPQLHFISNCKYISDGINDRNIDKLQWLIDYSIKNGCKSLSVLGQN